MGLFGSKHKCIMCSNDVGLLKFKLTDNSWLCDLCYSKCGFDMKTPIGTYTSQDVLEIRRKMISNSSVRELFIATKKVYGYLEIDDDKKMWLVPKGLAGKDISKSMVYKYDDIVSFELLEDDESIVKGGMGMALAGATLFGGVGAVVGGITGSKKNKKLCSSLKIKVTINDISAPTEYIYFITTSTAKDGFVYKSSEKAAHECLSLLQYMCNNKVKTQVEIPVNSSISGADEILKYKKLCDEGIITEDEFLAKKKQLLMM